MRKLSGIIALLIALLSSVGHAGIHSGGIGLEVAPGRQRLEILDLERKSDRLFSAGLVWFSFVNRANSDYRLEFRDANTETKSSASLRGRSIQMLSPYLNVYPLLIRQRREYFGLYAGARLSWDIPWLYHIKSDSAMAFTSLEMRDAWDDGYKNAGILTDLRCYVGAELAVSRYVRFDVKYGIDWFKSIGESKTDDFERYSFSFVERTSSPSISVSMTVGWPGRSSHCENCKGMLSIGYIAPAKDRERDRLTREIARAKAKNDCGKLLDISQRTSPPSDIRKNILRTMVEMGSDSCQRCLGRFAMAAPEADLAGLAVQGIANEDGLMSVAKRGFLLETRKLASERIQGRGNLFVLASESTDPELSHAIISRIQNDSDLFRIATNTNLLQRVREGAASRIAIPEMRGDLFESDLAPIEQAVILESLRDPGVLVRIIPSSKTMEVKRQAFEKLGKAELEKVAQAGYKDTSAMIAARVRLAQTDWSAVLATYGFRDVLDAITLSGKAIWSKELVLETSHRFMREGQSSRIPDLIELLGRHGDKALAEDFMNSGEPQLEAAAEQWAKAHGYNLGPGLGFHRVQWGQERRRPPMEPTSGSPE